MKFAGTGLDPEIKIYSIWGELVREIKTTDATGRAVWDGTNMSGDKVVTGIYLYQIKTSGGKKASGKISLVRE